MYEWINIVFTDVWITMPLLFTQQEIILKRKQTWKTNKQCCNEKSRIYKSLFILQKLLKVQMYRWTDVHLYMGYMKSHLQFHRVLGGMVWRMKGECKQSLGRMITFSPRIDLFSSLLYPGPGETQSEPGSESNIFELRHFWLKFEPPI